MSRKQLLADAGGTRIKVGLIGNGKLIKSATIPSLSGKGLIERLDDICLLKHEWLGNEKISGFGLAFAGIVDYDNCRVISVNEKFKDTIGFDFRAWATEKFGCPIAMENDARAAAIGEWKYGAGRGSDNMVMLTLGTGIGGSAIINGSVLRGLHFQAGCLLGHFTIDYKGKRCNCGNLGCVETVGSSWALPSKIKDSETYPESSLSKENLLDFEAVFRHAAMGDPLAIEVREDCMKSWAAALVNAIHAYDPEIAVVGGGVMESGGIILKYLENYSEEYAWTPWGKVQLKTAQLGNNSALWGMNYLLNDNVV